MHYKLIFASSKAFYFVMCDHARGMCRHLDPMRRWRRHIPTKLHAVTILTFKTVAVLKIHLNMHCTSQIKSQTTKILV
jgi:hypothetical protein